MKVVKVTSNSPDEERPQSPTSSEPGDTDEEKKPESEDEDTVKVTTFKTTDYSVVTVPSTSSPEPEEKDEEKKPESDDEYTVKTTRFTSIDRTVVKVRHSSSPEPDEDDEEKKPIDEDLYTMKVVKVTSNSPDEERLQSLMSSVFFGTDVENKELQSTNNTDNSLVINTDDFDVVSVSELSSHELFEFVESKNSKHLTIGRMIYHSGNSLKRIDVNGMNEFYYIFERMTVDNLHIMTIFETNNLHTITIYKILQSLKHYNLPLMIIYNI